MSESPPNEMKVAMHRADGDWHVVIERDGQQSALGGIEELIRILETLAAARQRPARGLR
jgi:hypothetical protein